MIRKPPLKPCKEKNFENTNHKQTWCFISIIPALGEAGAGRSRV
jgi:hypothetical protein